MIKLLIGIGGFLVGSLVSLAVSHTILSRDLAFIKGQLHNLLKVHDKLSKLYDRVLLNEKDMAKAQSDLNNAHEKIRDLKSA